jgi:serine protease Do
MSEQRRLSLFNGFVLGIIVTLLIIGAFFGGAVADRLFIIEPLDRIISRDVPGGGERGLSQRIISEESIVIDVAEKASPSVVTVTIEQERRRSSPFFMDPFGIFGPRFFEEGESETIERDIGSGFVVDQERGLVVTNKHVVGNTNARYTVVTKEDVEFSVERIYRDPTNDLAILKISGEVPPALALGDSDNLRVGQFALAIGTALGEFRHTVTTGVISGLGRGIVAGDGFGRLTEELADVIQTDTAINPGNSGGPLLNSAGQVIGVNTAVAQAQNIGFAIPINVVKEVLSNFYETGQFNRPFLGVRYRMISEETATTLNVVPGAYIVEVVQDSVAQEAGIREGDVITRFNNQSVIEVSGGLAKLINELRVGEEVSITLMRDGTSRELTVTMQPAVE